MDAAREGIAPPPELQLAWWCGDNRLPDTGGVYDQDYVTMSRMAALKNVYNLTTGVKSLHGEQIHNLTDNQRRLWRWLIDIGVW